MKKTVRVDEMIEYVELFSRIAIKSDDKDYVSFQLKRIENFLDLLIMVTGKNNESQEAFVKRTDDLAELVRLKEVREHLDSLYK